MAYLTREQAAEQTNRLFPGAAWKADDLGLYLVSFVSPPGQSIQLRMWLPAQALDLRRIVRSRLNLAEDTELVIERESPAVEAQMIGLGIQSPHRLLR